MRFEQKLWRARVGMFVVGFILLIGSSIAADISGQLVWWNVAPSLFGAFLLFISAPYVNGRLWGWISRGYFSRNKGD